jgi:V/A-type H+-transporting ATPase subunit D
MPRVNVPPTRSNLLRIKQQLAFAREGYDILDRQREVLTTELMHLAHDAERLQREVWEKLASVYPVLEKARMTMGRERVEWVALAVNKTVEVEIKNRGVMGVPLPVVTARESPPAMPYSLGDTMATIDGASRGFREVISQVPALAELTTSAWRLARELRRTQRRVNALKYVFIPDYEETVSFIESALEEREREETFRAHRLMDEFEVGIGGLARRGSGPRSQDFRSSEGEEPEPGLGR